MNGAVLPLTLRTYVMGGGIFTSLLMLLAGHDIGMKDSGHASC